MAEVLERLLFVGAACYFLCAAGETRTLMVLLPLDFESSTSTNSVTAANVEYFFCIERSWSTDYPLLSE